MVQLQSTTNDGDEEERWDGEQGPYTYAEFSEYYDHAEDAARDA